MSNEDWIIGAFLAFASGLFSDVGVQLQKIAHTQIAATKAELERQQSDDGSSEQRYYLLHPLWVFGLIVQGIGNLLNVLAVTFAPQTIIAPIGGASLIINMFLTAIMQKERVSSNTIAITLCITIGVVISIVFAPKPDTEQDTVLIIINMYNSYYFLVYGISIILLITSLWITCSYTRNRTLYRFCFPAFCGIVGGQNSLFAKGASKSVMLSFSSINKKNCLVYWEWYLILLGLFIFCISYVRWFNMGLQQFSPLHFYAIVCAFWILPVIIGGLVVFREMDQFQNLFSQIMFSIGTMVCIVSMFCLSRMAPPEKRNGHRTAPESLYGNVQVELAISTRVQRGEQRRENYQHTKT